MTSGAELPILASWQTFAMLMGTAAATLTGLMFIATTLMAGIDTHVSIMNAGLTAYHNPTVIHFCAVLFMAGILSAPWQALSTVSLIFGLTGLGMTIYIIYVAWRMRRMPGYQPPPHDWVWYITLPWVLYLVLIIAAVILPASPAQALYLISAVMLALLFISIRNAWDLVTYLAIERSHPDSE